MQNNFDYLKKYCLKENQQGVPFRNSFYKVNEFSIVESEKRLNYQYPIELRSFFLQIGCGFFKSNSKGEGQNTYSNLILGPISIADILLESVDNEQLHPEAEFEEGEMPFFEVGEMRDFLTMRPLSKNPNAVYHIDGELIDESFSNFIWRLYYESPTFYLDY